MTNLKTFDILNNLLFNDTQHIRIINYSKNKLDNNKSNQTLEIIYANKLNIKIIETISDFNIEIVIKIRKHKDYNVNFDFDIDSKIIKINKSNKYVIYPSFNNELFIINELTNIIRNNNITEIENILTELNNKLIN